MNYKSIINKKNITYGFIIIVIIIILKSLKDLFKQDDYETNDLEIGSTISNSVSNSIANQLHVAMGSMGTDFDKVKLAFANIKTQENFNKVSNSFGIRKYIDSFGVGSDIIGMPLNLRQWLHSELKTKQIEELNKLYPKIIF